MGEIGASLTSTTSRVLDLGNVQVVQKIKLAAGFSKWDDIDLVRAPSLSLQQIDALAKSSAASYGSSVASTTTISNSSSPKGDAFGSVSSAGCDSSESIELLEKGTAKSGSDVAAIATQGYKARPELKDYSCFRPFDEPQGVDPPAFATEQVAINLYTRVRRAWGFTPLQTKQEQEEKELEGKRKEKEEKKKSEKAKQVLDEQVLKEQRQFETEQKEVEELQNKERANKVAEESKERELKEAAIKSIDEEMMMSLSQHNSNPEFSINTTDHSESPGDTNLIVRLDSVSSLLTAEATEEIRASSVIDGK